MSQPPVQITAKPTLYIDVVINNTKQIYEVENARKLHYELGIALSNIDLASLDNPAKEQSENSAEHPE